MEISKVNFKKICSHLFFLWLQTIDCGFKNAFDIFFIAFKMLQRIVLLMYLWSCVESRFAFYGYTRHLHVVTHCIHIQKYICVTSKSHSRGSMACS